MEQARDGASGEAQVRIKMWNQVRCVGVRHQVRRNR